MAVSSPSNVRRGALGQFPGAVELRGGPTSTQYCVKAHPILAFPRAQGLPSAVVFASFSLPSESMTALQGRSLLLPVYEWPRERSGAPTWLAFCLWGRDSQGETQPTVPRTPSYSARECPAQDFSLMNYCVILLSALPLWARFSACSRFDLAAAKQDSFRASQEPLLKQPRALESRRELQVANPGLVFPGAGAKVLTRSEVPDSRRFR
ncbi:uncharacterized protein THITE_111639 [Thermothielavioides terrestris NRRL 8126]|uniref:Uncharacterized protein n=1 Tax=Thermothielavioides terrestris (strain ATCC 38088 / NRRL 8126) TaxID=578455 RepID=G2R507_THETT|nr:uncharacterized protein THITE_111639 [Thermothielavioides terrestris NRRL 8126]AEO65284.1 hypothetical protein THITE_111639 [Thermothielavioides terrestris NRRL 8126]